MKICSVCKKETAPLYMNRSGKCDICSNKEADKHNTKVGIITIGVIAIIIIAVSYMQFPIGMKMVYKTIKKGEVIKVEYIPSVFDKKTAIHFEDGQILFIRDHIQIPDRYIRIVSPNGNRDMFFWKIQKAKRRIK